MIKAVLFDFGGVLTQSGQSGFVTKTVADLYGVNPLELNISRAHAELRRGRGDEDAVFDVLNKKYGKHVTKEMFVKKANEAYVPSPEVYKLAASLRAHGVRTAIFSNIFAMNVAELRAQGSYEGFDPVILSCEIGYAKPDQEMYDIAVRQLAVDPQEILLIDDQEKCLGPAKAMGMMIVWAKTPSQIVADTQKLIRTENGIEL